MSADRRRPYQNAGALPSRRYATSINQHEYSGVLGGFEDILKLSSVAACRQTAADHIKMPALYRVAATPLQETSPRTATSGAGCTTSSNFSSAVRSFKIAGDVRDRFKEAQQQTALDRVIHILRQRSACRQRHRRIQLGRYDAKDVAPLIHQRPTRIASCTVTLNQAVVGKFNAHRHPPVAAAGERLSQKLNE